MPDSKEAIEKLEDLGAIVVEGESGLLVSLDETNVDEVIPLLRLKNVVDLEFLHSCGISNHHLKEFRNNSSVKKLAFHANFGLSEDAFSVLPTFGALEELILKVDMDLDPEPVFKNVGACKNLIKLLLIFPKSDDAARHLRFLTKLRDLKMKSQLQDLSFVRQMESLTHLNVGDNPIGDEDLLSIRCFKSLQDLSLFNTDISDKCGPTLSKFLGSSGILMGEFRLLCFFC